MSFSLKLCSLKYEFSFEVKQSSVNSQTRQFVASVGEGTATVYFVAIVFVTVEYGVTYCCLILFIYTFFLFVQYIYSMFKWQPNHVFISNSSTDFFM